MKLSQRTAWSRAPNALAQRRAALEQRGRQLVDLTDLNPTRCGLRPCEPEIRAALGAVPLHPYLPEPLGERDARAAVSAFLGQRGGRVAPEDVLLTSSTSESYARLFQLLCDPGDNVLVPAPSYPLFEYLAALESVELRTYSLEVDEDFRVGVPGVLGSADARTRAVVVLNPHHPTGVFLRRPDHERLQALCAARGWAIISDEVFQDYGEGTDPERVRSVTGEACPALTFHLGGLSKALALPQLKLGWMAVLGPPAARAEALARLELVCDAYLSVGGPVQRALPSLLALAPSIQPAVRARLTRSREALRASIPPGAPWGMLPSEGGWAGVLRLPAFVDEEALTLRLLEAGVLVHPGHFYDFPRGRYLVLSLLTPPEDLEAGLAAMVPSLGAVLA